MAQKISPLATRLTINRSSDSSWFDSIYTEKAIKADITFRNFLSHLGTHFSKSNNSWIVRIGLSSYCETTQVECFFASNNLGSDGKSHISQSGLSQGSKLTSSHDSLVFFNHIKYLNSSISQKLCALTFSENFKEGRNKILIPFNDKNYTLSFYHLHCQFQSASSLALSIAQDLSKGKSVNQTFSDISTHYALNPKVFTFVKGFRVQCKGRISNEEEASTETLEIGRIARGKVYDCVDFSNYSARTPLGMIGIKVWLNFKISN